MAFKQSIWGRVEVTVNRGELVKKIKKNREKHRQDHSKALLLWRQELKEILGKVNTESIVEFPYELERMNQRCPKTYVSEYDDIIEMFEMSMNDTVLLDSVAFRKFCKDEWDWKHELYQNYYYRKVREEEKEG